MQETNVVPSPTFFDEGQETISVNELRKLQLERLVNSIAYALDNSPFYRSKKHLYGEDTLITSLEDFARFPLTTKEELRSSQTYDILAVQKEQVTEVHFSSGTSGNPVYSFLTKNDIANGNKFLARTWHMQGVRQGSTFAMLASYGLFSAGLLNHYAIQHLGAFVLPVGGSSPEKTLKLLKMFSANATAAVASYYPYLASYAKEHGIDPHALELRSLIAGGEPFSEAERSYIQDQFGASMYDQYGLCEINTGIAGECSEKNGLHILADYVYPEIIHPETGVPLKEGALGELVLTTFFKEASPLLRYRTGDMTSITYEPCPCGRTMPRIARIERRVAETIFYKGIGIEKSYVAAILDGLKDRLNPYVWQLEVSRSGGKELALLKIVPEGEHDERLLGNVADYLYQQLGFRVSVNTFTQAELSNLGTSKLKHFIDNRVIS